ncbi:unnamed protein product [Polarella glacialis]|uniref:Uncharacterized protein n=1 Tax=Polarella glacialis TaxID=89957 RepID=A0A813HAK7_POLGL|nr:unnamed protein product [Polarella glacialis]
MEVTQIIAWIHRVMLTGLKPATDHLGCEWPPGSRRAMEAGSPFARQLLGAFAGFKSDLEARVLCHRLPRSYMHNFVCEHDLACVHLAHLQYGDFRSTAGWRTSAITHEDYMITSESSMSPWAEVPGWRKERNLDDTLHDIYQGIGPHLVASTIVHCILEEIPKCTLEKLDLKLKSLYTHSYKPWCRENKTDSAGNSFSGVKFNREKSNKTYPELGSVYKAYEVKVIIFWAAFYCKDKAWFFSGPCPGHVPLQPSFLDSCVRPSWGVADQRRGGVCLQIWRAVLVMLPIPCWGILAGKGLPLQNNSEIPLLLSYADLHEADQAEREVRCLLDGGRPHGNADEHVVKNTCPNFCAICLDTVLLSGVSCR